MRNNGDQAAGLRAMQMRQGARIIAVNGCAGAGRTSVVVNLAAALSQHGERVLVVDENLGRTLNGLLGVNARYDLLHFLQHEKTLAQVVVAGSGGIAVLPAARGLRVMARAQANVREQQRMSASLLALLDNYDTLLVDSATEVGAVGAAQQLGGKGKCEKCLVMSTGAEAIRATYTLIKRLHEQDGRNDFQVIINKAHDQAAASAAFDNLRVTARRYLGVFLELAGVIPQDGKLARATSRAKPVVEAYPGSFSALAFRRIAISLGQSKSSQREDEMAQLFSLWGQQPVGYTLAVKRIIGEALCIPTPVR